MQILVCDKCKIPMKERENPNVFLRIDTYPEFKLDISIYTIDTGNLSDLCPDCVEVILSEALTYRELQIKQLKNPTK